MKHTTTKVRRMLRLGTLTPRSRRRRSSGAELVEFTFTFLPLLVIVTALVSVSWGIFAKSALQYAVKVGARQGVTLSLQTPGGVTDVTSMVKNIVKQNSFGLLKDTSLIHVHYYQPPDPESTADITDVSTCPGTSTTSPCTGTPGNYPGNMMVVSVDGYSLAPIMLRLFAWNKADYSATPLNVSSGDLIEQFDPSQRAPMGTAP
jgi:TadE-like protein